MLQRNNPSARNVHLLHTMKSLFPTKSLAVLLLIGVLDLVSTAVLHAKGLIVEMNPIMRFFIQQSEWLFAFVKGLTIGAAWVTLAWYAKQKQGICGQGMCIRKLRLCNALAWLVLCRSLSDLYGILLSSTRNVPVVSDSVSAL